MPVCEETLCKAIVSQTQFYRQIQTTYH